MVAEKPQTATGYSVAQTGLAERTLVTVWRYISEYREHLVLVGGLVPRYLVDRVTEREVEVGAGHCGTMDVDFGISLGVADVETYKSIRRILSEKVHFERGTNEAGNKQKHSFVSTIEGQEISIDFLTTKYGGPTSKIRQVEADLSAIQAEGLGLALSDPLVVRIRGELLTGDGPYTAEVPICRPVPYVVLKALAFSDRGERKDAYDLVYTLIHYKDGPGSVAGEIRDDERNATSFERAVKEMGRLFASGAETGPIAYSNFVDREPTAAANAYAAVQEFLASL